MPFLRFRRIQGEGGRQQKKKFKHKEVSCIGFPGAQIDKRADKGKKNRCRLRVLLSQGIETGSCGHQHLRIKHRGADMEIDRIHRTIRIDDLFESVIDFMFIRFNQAVQLKGAITKG